MPSRHEIEQMIEARLTEFRVALMLLTRFPVRVLASERDVSASVWAYPVVGVVAALPGAIVFWAAAGWLPMSVAAILAIGTGLVVTGALHEDGLADLCDGLGGGKTRLHRLEIMRDSRIGTYGTLALILSLALRTTALGSVADATTGAVALLCFGAASRAGLPAIMLLQLPARTDGLGASIPRPPLQPVAISCGLGLVAIAISGAGMLGALFVAISIALLSWYCDKQIGGYTGDTLGAAQQVAELVCWLAILSKP